MGLCLSVMDENECLQCPVAQLPFRWVDIVNWDCSFVCVCEREREATVSFSKLSLFVWMD